MSRTAAVATLVAVSLLTLPAAARADGPPVGGWSFSGAVVGKERYLAVPIARGTLLQQVAVNGGQLENYRFFRREIGIPKVTLDGAGGGLSHDGRTLVMSPQATGYFQRSSEFDVLDARGLSVRRTIRLKGNFTFDAISPDGSTIYLIQLLHPSDPTRYAVQALDATTGRLAPKPIVDPREPDEQMRGLPYSRATSADGRYVYTLYSGGKKQFVHALDTTGRTAACIDLPAFSQDTQPTLRLVGRRLTVLVDNAPVSYVDTVTHRVTKAAPAGPTPAAATQPASDDGGAPPLWALLAGAAAAALGAAAAVGARRRRAGALRS